MTGNKILYLLPYLASLVLSIWILAIAWRHRHVQGAGAYVVFVAGQVLWTSGFIFELLSPTLPGKLFWDGLQWVFATIVVLAFPIFVIIYSGYKFQNLKILVSLLTIPAAFFVLLVATDPLHHLVYPNPHIQPEVGFPELRYGYTPVVQGFSLYGLMITLASAILLIWRFIRPHNLYRSQILTITLGFFIPYIGAILALMGIELGPQRDIMPIASVIGNSIVSWGLFYFRMFDVTPIARDTIIENMKEPVVVLDHQDRLVDINPAALTILKLNSSRIIGQPAGQIFASWLDLKGKFDTLTEDSTEIRLDTLEKTYHFDVQTTLLFNRRGTYTGRVFVARDITFRIELENDLQRLNHNLEERVMERTVELAEAYDTTLEGWARALEFRDKETEGHSRRVTGMTVRLAAELDCSEEDLIHIRRGAILHDIGKMAIPDDILRKPGTLTKEERGTVEQHPEIAYKLIKDIPFLQKAIEIPYCHHERWDGQGYPRGLKGENIPLSARIFAIVDVWDALISDRVYRQAMSRQELVEHIHRESGKYFDPHIVEVFLKLVSEEKI
jgi:PAS domain S-box-containing protein